MRGLSSGARSSGKIQVSNNAIDSPGAKAMTLMNRNTDPITATALTIPSHFRASTKDRVMKRAILLTTTLLLSLSLSAAEAKTPSTLPSVTLPAPLDRVLRDYEKQWGAGDATALAAIFAEDGFVLQNGQPPVRGRDAVRKAYTGSGGSPLFLRALAYAVEGKVGYIIGAYGSTKERDDGKFILALKRVGDRWLIAADIDNSSQPRRPISPTPTPTSTPSP